MHKFSILLACLLAVVSLSACGGGDGGGESSPEGPVYTYNSSGLGSNTSNLIDLQENAALRRMSQTPEWSVISDLDARRDRLTLRTSDTSVRPNDGDVVVFDTGDPEDFFALSVIVIDEVPGGEEFELSGREATFAEVFDSLDFQANLSTGDGALASQSNEKSVSLSHNIPLNNATISLGNSAELGFRDGSIDLGAEIDIAKFDLSEDEFDLEIATSASLSGEVYMSASVGGSGMDSDSIFKFNKPILIGWVPCVITAEVFVDTSGSWNVDGELYRDFMASLDAMVRLQHDPMNGWDASIDVQPSVTLGEPIVTIEGQAALEAALRARVTLSVLGIAGPWVEVTPYARNDIKVIAGTGANGLQLDGKLGVRAHWAMSAGAALGNAASTAPLKIFDKVLAMDTKTFGESLDLQVTSTPITLADVGQEYLYTIQTNGGVNTVLNGDEIPSWLTLNGSTLVGTPSASDRNQNFDVAITPVDGSDTGSTHQFTIMVGESTPAADDQYEENDAQGASAMLTEGLHEDLVWMDEDWFEVFSDKKAVIEVNLQFNNTHTNLDLEIYSPDDLTKPAAGSFSQTSEEVASVPIEANTSVFVRVLRSDGADAFYDLEIKRSAFFDAEFSSPVLFVLDISGSMSGSFDGTITTADGDVLNFPSRIRAMQEEAIKAIRSLSAQDAFDVIAFHSGHSSWNQGYAAATSANKSSAETWIRGLFTGGSTNLYDALDHGLQNYSTDPLFGSMGGLIVMTDGQPDSQSSVLNDFPGWFAPAKTNGAELFAVFIGSSSGRQFMIDLAQQNDGEFIEPGANP